MKLIKYDNEGAFYSFTYLFTTDDGEAHHKIDVDKHAAETFSADPEKWAKAYATEQATAFAISYNL